MPWPRPVSSAVQLGEDLPDDGGIMQGGDQLWHRLPRRCPSPADYVADVKPTGGALTSGRVAESATLRLLPIAKRS